MDPVVIGLVAAFIPIVAIVGGISVAVASVVSRAKVRQLEIRERIAMIEKGLVPAPEADPGGFERHMLMHRLDRPRWTPVPARHRRAGITLIGVGLGLMTLLYFVDTRADAFGIGGFITIVGIAFFINSLFEAHQQTPAEPTSSGERLPPAGS